MGTLYLVRHGQASLGADDYDQLSALGRRQSVQLGTYLKTLEGRFDTVVTGTLKRHRQTWEGISEGMQWEWPALAWPELNEYDSAALIHSLQAPPVASVHTPEGYRQHFRLLRDALRQWMAGVISPQGMPSYAAFASGVAQALERLRQPNGRVLVISSGGPIATAVAQLVGASAEASIELNLRMRNTSVTELHASPKRHSLVGFNAVPHLEAPAYRPWITHA
jgi:broad specificity phosphatase PhoE